MDAALHVRYRKSALYNAVQNDYKSILNKAQFAFKIKVNNYSDEVRTRILSCIRAKLASESLTVQFILAKNQFYYTATYC